MGVQLNIKDVETVDLARSLASALGKSVTETIREALEEKHRRREEEIAKKVRIGLEIAARASRQWSPKTDGMTSKEIMDSLYDEHGLPV